MADFPGLILTSAGRNLQAKAQIGQALQFLRVALGAGAEPADPEGLSGLVDERVSLGIQSLENIGDGTSRVRVFLTNAGLSEGFFIRELGLFARDPDTSAEHLYAYTNAANSPDFLPAEGGATVVEQTFDLITVIGQAQNVTAVIDELLTLATKEDLAGLATHGDLATRALSSRRISAGAGLTGGGDLTSDRTISLDYAGLTAVSAAGINISEDTLMIWDASASALRSVNMDVLTEKILASTRFSIAQTAGRRWIHKTGAYTAAPGDQITADMTGGAWTLTLPAGASAGDCVTVAVVAGDPSVSPLTLAATGAATISGVAGTSATATLETAHAPLTLIFDGTTKWRIVG